MNLIESVAVASDLYAVEASSGSSAQMLLALYVVLAIVAVGVGWVMRAFALDELVDPETEELTAPELGMLFSERQAVMAAIALLRAFRLVDSIGSVERSPTPDEMRQLDSFTLAVLDALSAEDRRTIGALNNRLYGKVGALRGTLMRRGYLAADDFLGHMRRGGLPIAIVGVIVFLHLLVGHFAGAPVYHLGWVLLGLGISWLLVPRARLTELGNRTRRNMTSRYQYLAPRNSPAYDTYGPETAAVGAAVFGAAALAGLDPVLAEIAEAAGVGGASIGDASGCAGGSDGGGCGGAAGCGGGGCGGGGGGGGG